MQVDWSQLWINIFGSVDGWFGIDWGFWVALGVVALFVIIENIFFWTRKPYGKWEKKNKNKDATPIDSKEVEGNKQK